MTIKYETKEFSKNEIVKFTEEECFNGLSKESIFARALLRDLAKTEFGILNFCPQSNHVGKALKTDGLYWSVSHKYSNGGYLIAVALSDGGEVGIDIEIINERSKELLNKFKNTDYEFFSEELDIWTRFYILWTAKESLIKKLGLSLDSMNDMDVLDFKDGVVNINYEGENYNIVTHLNTGSVYSLAV